jgi:hypothetical protein
MARDPVCIISQKSTFAQNVLTFKKSILRSELMTDLRGVDVTDSEADLQRTPHLLSMRVPPDLYRDIASEAAELGVSVSDAARHRLRTGRAINGRGKQTECAAEPSR